MLTTEKYFKFKFDWSNLFFVDQSDLKLDPTAKHFSFGSFNSLGAVGAEKEVIINKIASALTVRAEVS